MADEARQGWCWCTGRGRLDELAGPVAVSLAGGRLEGMLSPRRRIKRIPERMTYRGPLPQGEGQSTAATKQVQTEVHSRDSSGHIAAITFSGACEEKQVE